MTISQDWTLEYAGLQLGDGTSYEVPSIEGLADQPALRTSDRTRLRRHGLLPGDDFLDGRSVTIELEVFGADDAAFSAAVAALKLALSPGGAEAPLAFKLPGVAGGGVRRLNARPRRFAMTVDIDRFFHRQPRAVAMFEATDPRIYDDALSSLQTTLPSAGGGLTFNATANFVFGAVSTGGTIITVNAGNFGTPPTFRIDGPCTNPSIECVTTGEILKFTADGGLTLGSGEFILVDTDARTVLLGGTASRYSKVSSDSTWFDLTPGNCEVRFRAVTGTTATLTVTWRSAWL